MSQKSAAVAAIAVHELHKSFGAVHAVDGLDLHVAIGEVVAFLGPNGAGKSTTLDVVLGFTRADCGTVEVLGGSPAAAIRQGRIGAVLQAGGLLPGYTVRETLEVVASLQVRSPDLPAIIAQTDLAGLLGRRISKCSGGEVQRIRLALALLAQPEVLILDEPTTGLDPTARAAFWQTMRAQTAQGRAILFATHYLQEAADFADRIVIIHHGRVVAEGSVDEIRGMGAGTMVTATWPGLTGPDQVRSALASMADEVLAIRVNGAHLEVLTSGPDEVARLLLTTTPAGHLGMTAPSLEKVFSELVTDDSTSAAA